MKSFSCFAVFGPIPSIFVSSSSVAWRRRSIELNCSRSFLAVWSPMFGSAAIKRSICSFSVWPFLSWLVKSCDLSCSRVAMRAKRDAVS